MQRVFGQLLRSLLQNPPNFSEVAPEVYPVVHTALLCLICVTYTKLLTFGSLWSLENGSGESRTSDVIKIAIAAYKLSRLDSVLGMEW